LFGTLAAGPQEAEVLATKVGLHARGARPFLDALVQLGFLERSGDIYRNTAEADFYLDPAKPSYVGLLFGTPGQGAYRGPYGYWDRLTAALKSGQPQTEAAGLADRFTAYYADPRSLEHFLGVMNTVALPSARAIATAFPWQQAGSVADIGAALGGLLVEVMRDAPGIKGIGFDLPVVEPLFSRYVTRQGMESRIRFAPGNFHDDPLPQADVLVFGHVLHDWSVEIRRMLIGKAHAALPAGGSVLIYDAMLDGPHPTNLFGLLSSLNLMIKSPGGSEYTTDDCSTWLRAAGFRETEVRTLPGADSLVIGRK
jgi:O-methyltransferase domain/Dimerisation domain